MSSLIHPSACIDPQARLAPDVRVGPFAVIVGPVTIGAGCVIHAHAQIRGPLIMGARNVVHGTAVLGDWPQDHKFTGEFSEVVIGDDNVFREGVTIHRGTGEHTRTVVGNHCYLMVNAHVGHNCIVGNNVTMVNGSMLGGFVQVGDRAIIGGNTAVHQFCRIGRLVMLSNACCMNVDVPPFFTSLTTNHLTQLNAVGLRRAGIPKENIDAIRHAFQILFRSNRILGAAIELLPADLLKVPEVAEMVKFCKETKRGIARFKAWSTRGGEGAVATEE